MRITEAAQRLGTSPRMLRYRETLGLLPVLGGAGADRGGPGGGAQRGAGRGARPGHRQFRDQDLAVVALGLDLERRLDISPAALAFGLRVLAEPAVRAQVAELGRRIGRVPPPPGSALDFEKERALRLLSMGQRPVRPAQTDRPGAARPGRTLRRILQPAVPPDHPRPPPPIIQVSPTTPSARSGSLRPHPSSHTGPSCPLFTRVVRHKRTKHPPGRTSRVKSQR